MTRWPTGSCMLASRPDGFRAQPSSSAPDGPARPARKATAGSVFSAMPAVRLS
ncbi:MAG: hypothetical protein ACRDPT_14785 [Streptomycetales bacterium]